jgi:CheY-like chemotaxis protein
MAEGSAECGEDVCRVLVVEDNPDVARLLERALEFHGHQTETTRNGTEAIAVAAQQRPHVALIDIGLPGVDGIYVARELRQLVPDALLIAVTGRSDQETVRRCLAAGFDHHYSKPIELETIIDLLDDWKARSGCAA